MVQADIRVSFMAPQPICESQGSIRILPQGAPLCDFHAALIVQMLHRFNLPSTVTIGECTGTQGAQCVTAIEIGTNP